MNGIKILDCRPLTKNNLIGFCRVEFPSGTIINDITILTGKFGLWAAP
jgi:hypothetical protein